MKVPDKPYAPFDQKVHPHVFTPQRLGLIFSAFSLSWKGFLPQLPTLTPQLPGTLTPLVTVRVPMGDPYKGSGDKSRDKRCPQETGALLHLPSASCTFPHLLILFPSTKRPKSPKMYPKTLLQLSPSMSWGSSEAGPSDHFSLQSLASFYFFFFPQLSTQGAFAKMRFPHVPY